MGSIPESRGENQQRTIDWTWAIWQDAIRQLPSHRLERRLLLGLLWIAHRELAAWLAADARRRAPPDGEFEGDLSKWRPGEITVTASRARIVQTNKAGRDSTVKRAINRLRRHGSPFVALVQSGRNEGVPNVYKIDTIAVYGGVGQLGQPWVNHGPMTQGQTQGQTAPPPYPGIGSGMGGSIQFGRPLNRDDLATPDALNKLRPPILAAGVIDEGDDDRVLLLGWALACRAERGVDPVKLFVWGLQGGRDKLERTWRERAAEYRAQASRALGFATAEDPFDVFGPRQPDQLDAWAAEEDDEEG